MEFNLWCDICGESYEMKNLREKKDGFSFDLIHSETFIAKTLQCKNIHQKIQGYYGNNE